ncbi:hypothetical protein [Paenibacillus glucanolyticus]|uniref:hypothetical protein n=1 Tax=Paenibacillus glucanolyticus TaxID=59843 RepID=UPI00096E029D|nr:hypothetical protein [Paenibacillus glucanolyticus]OMF76683.1 hypothetical protein BK142_14270 [Paenibacillus glucanolyticus]
MNNVIIPAGYEVVSMGKSLWLVDSEALSTGKFIGKEIVSDITEHSKEMKSNINDDVINK